MYIDLYSQATVPHTHIYTHIYIYIHILYACIHMYYVYICALHIYT